MSLKHGFFNSLLTMVYSPLPQMWPHWQRGEKEAAGGRVNVSVTAQWMLLRFNTNNTIYTTDSVSPQLSSLGIVSVYRVPLVPLDILCSAVDRVPFAPDSQELRTAAPLYSTHVASSVLQFRAVMVSSFTELMLTGPEALRQAPLSRL